MCIFIYVDVMRKSISSQEHPSLASVLTVDCNLSFQLRQCRLMGRPSTLQESWRGHPALPMSSLPMLIKQKSSSEAIAFRWCSQSRYAMKSRSLSAALASGKTVTPLTSEEKCSKYPIGPTLPNMGRGIVLATVALTSLVEYGWSLPLTPYHWKLSQ